MKNTGEQFVPGISSQRLADEHLARYAFVKKFVFGKDVLDIACGTGYGSNELGSVARGVWGVDVSISCIEYACTHFIRDNLTYICADGTGNCFQPNTFDVICSFETIEHLDERDRRRFVRNLASWLRPNGKLILSTPNKKITSPWSKKPLNPYHVIEFSRSGLEKELENEFFVLERLGQRMVKKIFVFRFVRLCIRFIEKVFRLNFRLYDLSTDPEVTFFHPFWEEPRVQVVVCKPNK